MPISYPNAVLGIDELRCEMILSSYIWGVDSADDGGGGIGKRHTVIAALAGLECYDFSTVVSIT